jgi:hypothetical protein
MAKISFSISYFKSTTPDFVFKLIKNISFTPSLRLVSVAKPSLLHSPDSELEQYANTYPSTVFQIAREIIARTSRGHLLGIFNNNPNIILIEPRVSATERLCSLNNTERSPSRGKVPQNQKITPTPMQV